MVNPMTSDQYLQKIQMTKQKINVRNSKETDDFLALAKELEYEQVRIAQQKSDMLMITKIINDMDSSRKFLTPIEAEKKNQLESLLTKRQRIKEKEDIFFDQIKEFHNEYSMHERMRMEKGFINDEFLTSKREKVLSLKLMREQIENDKLNFLDQFEQIKTGSSLQFRSKLGRAGASIVDSTMYNDDIGNFKDKIQRDQLKLQQMKQDQMYFYSKNQLQVDPDEIYGNNKINYGNEVRYLLDTGKHAPNNQEKLKKLEVIRQNIERYGIERGLNVSKVKLRFFEEDDKAVEQYKSTLHDIDQLRKDYISAGGTDPEFLLNLNNLEAFYKSNRFNPNNLEMLNNPQIMTQNLGQTDGVAQQQFRQQQPSLQSMNTSQMNYQSQSNNLNYSQQPPQQQQIPQSASMISKRNASSINMPNANFDYNREVQGSQFTQHPVFKYLPQTFKQELAHLEEQNRVLKNNINNTSSQPSMNQPLSGQTFLNQIKQVSQNGGVQIGQDEEQVMDYLRRQEATLLMEMGQLKPEMPEYVPKYQQFIQLQQLKGNLEKSILDKKVQQAIINSSTLGQTNPYNQNASTMQSTILPQNISNYDFQNGQQDPNNTNNLVKNPHLYNPNEGFILRFDFINSLPINFDKIRINYGIFRKGDNFFTYRMTKDKFAERETNRTNKSIVLEKEIIHDIQPFPDSVIYLEIWAWEHDYTGHQSRPFVLGWSAHELFDYTGTMIPGKFKVPFYSKDLLPSILFQDGLPYLSSSFCFFRVCLPLDPYLDIDTNILLENEYLIPPLHLREKKVMRLNDGEFNQQDMPLRPPIFQMPLVRELDDEFSDKPVALYKSAKTGDRQRPPTSIKNKKKKNSQDLDQEDSSDNQDDTNSGKNVLSQKSIKKNAKSKSKKDRSNVPTNQREALYIKIINLYSIICAPQVQIRNALVNNQEICTDYNGNPCADSEIIFGQAQDNNLILNYEKVFDIKVSQLRDHIDENQVSKQVFFISFFTDDNSQQIGWMIPQFFKLNKKGKIEVNSGRFKENLIIPPALSPPFDGPINRSGTIAEYIIAGGRFDLLNDEDEKRRLSELPIIDLTVDGEGDGFIQNGFKGSLKKQKDVLVLNFGEIIDCKLKGKLFQIQILIYEGDIILKDEENNDCIMEGDQKQIAEKKLQFNEELAFTINFDQIIKDKKYPFDQYNIILIINNEQRQPQVWTFHKIFNQDYQLNEKKDFMIDLYNTPVPTQPSKIDIKKIKLHSNKLKISIFKDLEDIQKNDNND